MTDVVFPTDHTSVATIELSMLHEVRVKVEVVDAGVNAGANAGSNEVTSSSSCVDFMPSVVVTVVWSGKILCITECYPVYSKVLG